MLLTRNRLIGAVFALRKRRIWLKRWITGLSVPPRQLLKWKAKFAAKGIPTEGPLQLGPPGQASLYFNDPFGSHLEFTCLGFSNAVAIRPPVPERLVWDAVQLP
jgi:hypothetical protein